MMRRNSNPNWKYRNLNRYENTSHSAILNSLELVLTPASVPTNSTFSRNRFTQIPSLPGIPYWNRFPPHSHASWCGQRLVPSMCKRFQELSQTEIGKNWTEFRPVASYFVWTGFRNSGNRMELVPLTELIPQCSTSRNRITAHRYGRRT
jgi:hypothetical protein